MPQNKIAGKLVTARDLEAEATMWRRKLDRSSLWCRARHRIFDMNRRWYMGMQRVLGHTAEGERILEDLRNEFSTSINRLLPSLATQTSSISFRVPWFRARMRRYMNDPEEMKLQLLERVQNYVLQGEAGGFEDALEDFTLNFFLGYGTWKATFTPDSAKPPFEREAPTGELLVEDEGIEIAGGVPRLVGDRGEERAVVRDGEFELDDFDPSEVYQLQSLYWGNLRHDPEGGRFYRNHEWTAERMCWKLRDFLDQKDEVGWTHIRDIEKAAKSIDDVWLHHNESYLRGQFSTAAPFLTETIQAPRNMLPREFIPDEELEDLRLFGWEIWNHKKRKVEYLIDDHPFLVSPEDNKFPKWVGFSPYEFAMVHHIPDEWYPLTEVEFFIPTMKIYDLMQGKRVTHARRFNRKYEVARHEVEDDDLEFLKDPDDGTIIQTDTGNAVRAIEDARADVSIFNDMEIAIRDGNEVIGSTSESRGAAEADSATAAAIMERRGSTRELKKRLKIARATSRAATRLFNGIQATLDRELTVSIIGPDGELYTDEVSRAGIQGGVDFVIEIAEMAAGGDQVEQSRFMQLISLFGPSLMQEPEVVEEAARVFTWENPKMQRAILRHFQAIPTEMLLQGPQGAGATGADTAGSAGETGRVVGRISREAR